MDKYASAPLSELVERLQDNKVLDESDDYRQKIAAYCKAGGHDYIFQFKGDDLITAKAYEAMLREQYAPMPLFKEAILQSGYGSTTNDW